MLATKKDHKNSAEFVMLDLSLMQESTNEDDD
jgi:hypothetical protein